MHKKALYNLLRLNWRDDPSLYVDPWQVEDYRMLPVETLFERLAERGIQLNKESLIMYIDQVSDPEDLVDCFTDVIADPADLDAVYLLIFELWRKLAPDRYTLSLFCDEIDYRIEMYDCGLTEAQAAIEEIFGMLADMLDQNSESSTSPQEVFSAVCERCATDIESFFYDFVSDLIEQGSSDVALEFVDRLYPYVEQTHWLAFLKLRLATIEESEDIERLTAMLFESFSEDWDLDFSFEVLDFIIQTEQMGYFLPLIKHLFLLAQVEQDFRDLLFELRDFVEEQGYERELAYLSEMIERRSDLEVDSLIERDDPDLQATIDLIMRMAHD